MAFDIQKLETAHAAKGAKLWTYDPGSDNIDDIEGAGYFDAAANHFQEGDMLHVRGNAYVISDITAGVVTIVSGGKNVTIALAASATTDGMDITITVTDAMGNTIEAVHLLDVWISEAATGIGITGDTYSGDVTVVTGSELVEHVSKKVFQVTTTALGVCTMLAVDSGNPADQYIAVGIPGTGRIAVSAASGTSWEGA